MKICRDQRKALTVRLFLRTCSTLFAGAAGLENAKQLVARYKQGELTEMTPELWKAKKIVDSTIHPGAWTLLSLSPPFFLGK